MALGTLLLATLVPLGLRRTAAAEKTLPEQAQIIDQKSFAVLETVPPPSEANASTVRCLLLSLFQPALDDSIGCLVMSFD